MSTDSLERVGNLKDDWGNVHNEDLCDGECKEANGDEERDATTRGSHRRRAESCLETNPTSLSSSEGQSVRGCGPMIAVCSSMEIG